MFNNYILDPQRLQPGATNLAAVNDELPVPPAMSDFNFGLPPLGMPAFDARAAGGSGQFDERMMQQQMMMMMSMQQMMMANMGMGAQGGGALGMGGMGVGPMGAVPMNGGAGGRDRGNGARRQGGPGGAGGGGGVDVDAAGPPPGGEDPRARKGRVSYQDLDSPGGAGDGGLPY